VSLLDEPGLGVVVLLTIVLIASIAAGSLLMIAVSLLLLAIFGGLAYRARAIERAQRRNNPS
jgi:hypothetical protein